MVAMGDQQPLAFNRHGDRIAHILKLPMRLKQRGVRFCSGCRKRQTEHREDGEQAFHVGFL